MPHLALITTDGDPLGAVEFAHADPPDGTLIEHEDGMLRVVGLVDDVESNPEQFAVVVVELILCPLSHRNPGSAGSRLRRRRETQTHLDITAENDDSTPHEGSSR